MIEEMVTDITLDYLKDTEIGAKLFDALQRIQKVQEAALAYVNDDSSDDLKKIRIGTVLILALYGKWASGKGIKDLTSEDWEEIATKVADYAIIPEGKQYSVFIFNLYTEYVDTSVNYLRRKKVSEDKLEAISNIAIEVRDLGTSFAAGIISEVDYTEKCLWLLLEAMIKILCAYTGVYIGEDKAEFIESVSMLAFEYGRYMLYRREQELLAEYLEHQCQVDEELEIKFNAFKEELIKRQEEFNSLINDAFDPDISKRLRSTVELARSVGVDDSEILDSVEKVDEYFLY